MTIEKLDTQVGNDNDNQPYYLTDEDLKATGPIPIPNHLRTKSLAQMQSELANEQANKGTEDGN